MYTSLVIYLTTLCFIAFIDAKISYTRESYTIAQHSKPCITDCINGTCISNQRGKIEECTPGTEPAWLYHTYQRKYIHNFCLSRCGNFGEEFDWCFVSDYLEWDYCNSKKFEENDLKSALLTTTGIPCKHIVTGSVNNACINIDDTLQHHYGEEVNFVEASSADEQKCVSTCSERYEHPDGYRKCYDKNNTVNDCAPPARNLISIEEEMYSFINKVKRRSNPKNVTNYTKDHIKFLDSIKGVIKVNMNNSNSVTKYIMMPAFYGDEAFLPLIIKANVTEDSIKTESNAYSLLVIENVMLMGNQFTTRDDDGLLIPQSLGGPVSMYNVVPLSRTLSSGFLWTRFEREIKEDILNGKCSMAEMTVAVVYNDFLKDSRPIGFVVTEERYDRNRFMYHGVYDAFFANDPNDA